MSRPRSGGSPDSLPAGLGGPFRLPRESEPAPAPVRGPAEDEIRDECMQLADMLCAKNRAYGNSALEPLRVFSRSSAVEQILVRLDDKLSRLARGSAAGEDVELDLLGYLVLLRIARKQSAT